MGLDNPRRGGASRSGGAADHEHLEPALGHYQRARMGVTRAERVEALMRAEAAFQAAGPPYARLRQRVRELREQLEAGGIDELPPLPPSS